MQAEPFLFPYTIGLHDSDAAGIIFSANLFRICHEACEAMLAELGFSIGYLLRQRPFGLPVVHMDGDFIQPSRVGDHVTIEARVTEMSRSSYRVEYKLFTPDGTACARAAVVHVVVDTTSYKSMPMPEDFRLALSRHYLPE